MQLYNGGHNGMPLPRPPLQYQPQPQAGYQGNYPVAFGQAPMGQQQGQMGFQVNMGVQGQQAFQQYPQMGHQMQPPQQGSQIMPSTQMPPQQQNWKPQ